MLSFDTIKDFAPISLFVQSPSVLAVHPSLPVKSVKELMAFSKSRPNEILFSLVAHAQTKERLLAMGLDPVGSAPDEFTAYLKTETAKWGKLVREAGIRAN